ncbi:Na+/H+ antiporter subunit C [Paracoccus sp. S-4012]|uniref:Na+/H+ antiporter subunit C n=1 Tax=Paracoccus sp. S-4012 TaxID=2665648 RepID=UPI0012B0162E|nr:Na+/H+ antiporter subunit C [Paracoccus sp. S-4012]MRX51930.1 Na+/H+ antiporter subunit C [Paracoccus sp. S-4012]
MELLVAACVGMTTMAAVYLILQRRSFPVIVGMSLLSYSVNVFLFATGGLAIDAPPLLTGPVPDAPMTDPLPQALVLTAIVISFGMTAVVVVMSLGAFFQSRSDRIDLDPNAGPDSAPATGAAIGIDPAERGGT